MSNYLSTQRRMNNSSADLTLIHDTDKMSSLEIAELTGKQHTHVMRDIRNLVDNLKKSNESTSGLVDCSEDYHRLSPKTHKAILDFAFKNSSSSYIVEESSYKDEKGELRAMYLLNKKVSLLLASGYNVILRAKIIDRWEALETGKALPIVKKPKREPTLTTKVRVSLEWVKGVSDILNLNDSSKLSMLKMVAEPLGLPTPDYTKSKGILKSASELLKANQSKMSCQEFNKIMIDKGFIKIMTRESSKGEKKFKSIIGDGLTFGENQINPNNPKETQPLWYEEKFKDLLALLN